jgi:hypothetical protein
MDVLILTAIACSVSQRIGNFNRRLGPLLAIAASWEPGW